MPTEPQQLPAYLEDLCRPTPGGVAKLLAAWPGLSVESQVLVLLQMERSHHPVYMRERVLREAMMSANAYVRYLASSGYSRSAGADNPFLLDRTGQDADPLVRYCPLERYHWLRDRDPGSFFALPHEARLACVRNLTGDGAVVAALISHAVENLLPQGAISELEIFELVLDYLHKPHFMESYQEMRWQLRFDGFGDYLEEHDLTALWELVPKVPPSVAAALLGHLPEPEDGDIGGIVMQVDPRLLPQLLCRQDFQARELRKRLFFESAAGIHSPRSAAAMSNFDFTHTEFAKIVQLSPADQATTIRDLILAKHLSLVYYVALSDLIRVHPDSSLYSDIGFLEASLSRRLAELTGDALATQVLELRIYRLARLAAPWKKEESGWPPRGELAHLNSRTIPDDTWGTFVAYFDEWRNKAGAKDLERHLPQIDGVTHDEPPPTTHAQEQLVNSLAESFKEHVASALNVGFEKAAQRQTQSLADALRPLSDMSLRITETVSLTFVEIRVQLEAAKDALSRLKWLAYLLVALVGWLIWQGR